MIQTELLRLVEAGLVGDVKRVADYANLLSERYKELGDREAAAALLKAVSRSTGSLVSLDDFAHVPVDQETRLTIADVTLPQLRTETFVIPAAVRRRVEDFISGVRQRDELASHGIEAPASLLLYGPPGCGKTTLANHIAAELGFPILTARFDSLISPLLGNTSKNIRKIFQHASGKNCVLFLDEFDAIGKARDDKYELGELKRVINALLQNIDSFSVTGVLIAATNHPELLDRAIWRRFTTIIELSPPQEDEILALIRSFLGSKEIIGMTAKREALLPELLANQSQSAVKAICQACLRRALLAKKPTITFADLALAIIEYSAHSALSDAEIAEKMRQYGIPQRMISDTLGISRRQVRS